MLKNVQTPVSATALSPDRVAVWQTRLDVDTATVNNLANLLSPDEQQRAARYVFAEHRRRFTVARARLRLILGHYLNQPPRSLRFIYNAAGKPALEPDIGLCFNVTHSHELALYAIAWRRVVGIDLEYWRPLADLTDLAASCFSAQEFATWQGLPTSQQQAAFYNGWTRKEAYIKALGQGLMYPLSQFDVSLTPGEPARLLRVAGQPQETDRWSMQELHPESGYTAALVAAGQSWQLETWHYDIVCSTSE